MTEMRNKQMRKELEVILKNNSEMEMELEGAQEQTRQGTQNVENGREELTRAMGAARRMNAKKIQVRAERRHCDSRKLPGD